MQKEPVSIYQEESTTKEQLLYRFAQNKSSTQNNISFQYDCNSKYIINKISIMFNCVFMIIFMIWGICMSIAPIRFP